MYLNATRLDFYYNRFLIEGDGNVRIRTSDGFTVTGDSFSMDLKLNRFMVAGHVTLHDATGTVNGAAIADFFDFRRIYFVPVTSEPYRCTFLDGDLAHPVKGREMPGDAFCFGDVIDHPSIPGIGQYRNRHMRFINAHTYLNAGIPLGTYVVNFPQINCAEYAPSERRPNLNMVEARTPLLPPFALRSDLWCVPRSSSIFGEHEYAILSVNPATRAEKWWNSPYEKLGSLPDSEFHALTLSSIPSRTSGAQQRPSQRYVRLPHSYAPLPRS